MEIANYTIEVLGFLFLIGIVAGLLDTLAGGGGLVALPALIISGVPPLAALGTNKLQGAMGTATATILLLKKRKIHWQDIKHLMFFAFIGAGLGTILVQFIDTSVLSFIIPLVLVFIAVYFLLSPNMSNKQQSAKLSNVQYKRYVVPTIGFYDGMFGPGTGSFFALAGVSFRGHPLITSTAIAKSLNFSTNIASLIVFIFAGKIIWVIGGLMMLGQVIGAWVGSHFLYKVNPQHLRIIVVIMCFVMLARYAFAMNWV